MLVELRIRDLGVIAEAHLLLGPGMTAVTGETGAGKTLLVEAIELLVGGRADGVRVRAGTEEAWVEGRFLAGDQEVVLARAVPAAGRSRAYVDGRMAPVGALADASLALVDLHGQHAHQSLLAPALQRAALDTFGAVDHARLVAAREAVRNLEDGLAALGGDEGARAREIDMLRFQVAEIDAAGLTEPDEEVDLEAEEDRLADAGAHREAAAAAAQALTGDGGASDSVGVALTALSRRAPLAGIEGRLRALATEVAEAAADLRAEAEALEDDPERLAWVRSRRSLLRELVRKYAGPPGRGSLADVVAFGAEARSRLAELESYAERAAALERQREAALTELARAEAGVARSRRRAAPRLASAVEAHLRELAMPAARFEVQVGDEGPGDQVAFLLGANPGEPLLPLAKVASGGELSRAMLAVRLVLGHQGDEAGPGTVVFDEVDAGVGGQAALAVGRALALLAGEAGGDAGAARQVLVVTHLPQVAAFADHQVAVRKLDRGGRTVAEARVVAGEGRVVELSRMLSGQPESPAARGHAEELLAVAAKERGTG